jgi:import receptor subunit TOM70
MSTSPSESPTINIASATINVVMAPTGTIPTGPMGTPSAPIPADSSLWDRISTWVSEHKAVVYTIAGVAVVVTTAGAVYYVRNGASQVSACPVADPEHDDAAESECPLLINA